MTREEVLSRAIAVGVDREKIYGPAADNAATTAAYWSVLFGVKVEPWQVAAALVLLKLSRLHADPAHEDSWVDIAGYAAYGGEVAT